MPCRGRTGHGKNKRGKEHREAQVGRAEAQHRQDAHDGRGQRQQHPRLSASECMRGRGEES